MKILVLGSGGVGGCIGAYLSKADKGVFSFAEKLCKPDLKIYQLLIDRYQLKPEDCVFVDDRLENIEAAKQLGFSVVHCSDVTKLSEEFYEKIK